MKKSEISYSTTSGFWSGFAASGFSVGSKDYGGIVGRTAIMVTVSGTVSEATGDKFANGAVSGVFVHLFNNEYANIIAFGNRKEDKIFDGIGNKIDDINKKSVVSPIYNGLSRDIPKAYNNAHPATQMCLDVSLTIVEYGFTGGMSQPFNYAYDFISGANFNTIPTSGAGWTGKAYDEFAR